MGVWIETDCLFVCGEQSAVTPCMGVWIETPLPNSLEVKRQSHPVWVCGLKRFSRSKPKSE